MSEVEGQVCFDELSDNPRGRISRAQMFMEMAEVIAKRGTCSRARVGAILVDPMNNVVSIGYNGSPHGEPHCDEVGHLLHNNHCIRTIHAEENCIARAEFKPYQGYYTLYVTHYPCLKCQVMLYETCRKNSIHMLVIYGKDYGASTYFSSLKEVDKVLQFSLNES